MTTADRHPCEPGLFRKKPVVVEAMRVPDNMDDLSLWGYLIGWLFMVGNADAHQGDSGTIILHTLEGDMTAKPGDWIIKGVQGEFYPCKDSIFRATYDPC